MSLEVVTIKVIRGIFKNYSYIGNDSLERRSFLVDPAWELEKIEQSIQQSNNRCDFILLTHSHPDHVDLADEIAVRYGIPVYMSKREVDQYQFQCHNLIPVNEGDSISIGSNKIIPISTPGHTHGSMCFLFKDNLFTGDTLFAEGCGMCIGKGADPGSMFQSIQRLKAMIPPKTRIFPGHSYGQPPGHNFSWLLQHNIYLQIEQREDFIAYRMRSGQTGWANFT